MLQLEATPQAVGLARNTVDRFRERLPEQTWEDARLLVSELVTNSVRHAAMAPWQQIELTLGLENGVFRAVVLDPGSGFTHAARSPDPARDGGWGLFLVDRVADRWGVAGDGEARVWFELDTDTHGTPPSLDGDR